MMDLASKKLLHLHQIFRLFKYSVYGLLALNILLFLLDEWQASGQVFSQGVSRHHHRYSSLGRAAAGV